MVGERSDDGGAEHDGWVLAPMGGEALNPARTLRSLDILDGAALQLHPRRPPVAEPIFDDVVDAIATSVRAHTDTRALRDLTGASAAGPVCWSRHTPWLPVNIPSPAPRSPAQPPSWPW